MSDHRPEPVLPPILRLSHAVWAFLAQQFKSTGGQHLAAVLLSAVALVSLFPVTSGQDLSIRTTGARKAGDSSAPPSPPREAPQRPTIEDAVSAARRGHPALSSASAEIRRSQHLVFQDTRPPNPIFGYAAAEVGNEGRAGQQGVFLSQNFVRGNKLELSGRVRRTEVSIAEATRVVRQAQIDADTRVAFLQIAVTQERHKLLAKLQTSLDRAVQTSNTLFSTGIISRSAQSQVLLTARRNQMQIQSTEQQRKMAAARLAALTGDDTFIHQEVDATILRPDSILREIEDLWQHIQETSPELRLATCRYTRTHAVVRRETAEPIPDLRTQWNLQQDASTNQTVVGIQIGVELPIRNNNSGAIDAARADTWQAYHDVESIRRSLRQRLVLTYGSLQQADQQLSYITNQLQTPAKENLIRTQQAFSLGEASYLDLLNSQRAYITLSLDTLKYYQQRAEAVAHLQTGLVRAELDGR